MSTDRAQPGYRAWQQKIRSRAARRLQHTHPNDWRTLLAEEQALEPFTPPHGRDPQPESGPCEPEPEPSPQQQPSQH